jgi:4-amino-4-deoxy-L-arabinose transferase-like glycosyltransferase
VTESTNQAAEKTWTESAARIGWTILIVATLYVCYFSHLGAIGFVGPDEPRYAWVARDMVETGDWVTPHLYGKPWFEKPPLFYWGAALCFKLFGVSEAAARLPSAISALLATLAMAWLALRLYGAETARWLLLLLPTTVGMIGFSHAAATDMPFSSMLTIAMVAAAVAIGLTRNDNTPSIPRTPWLALVLFGFFLGLAVLAKGPAAIILCGGAVFFWALFTKRWRNAFRLLHPVAIAAFSFTALPWYLLCARRNPDFFRVFLIEHNFKRYLTPEFQHVQPFWYYIPILVLAFLPWTLMFIASFTELVRGRKSDSLPSIAGSFFSCWAGFTVVFFSSSQSKLPGYILPALPPLAMLLAYELVLWAKQTGAVPRWIGTTVGATGMTLAAALFFLGHRMPFAIDSFPPAPIGLASIGMFAAGIAALVYGWRRRPAVALLIFVIALNLVLFGTLTRDARWSLDLGVSTRWAAKFAARSSPDWAANSATYKLRRSFQYSLNFYAHRELPQWSGGSTAYRWVFTSPNEMVQFKEKGFECTNFMAYPAVIVCERQ